MKVTKYQNVINDYYMIKKKYDTMLIDLQKDIRKNCNLKMNSIATLLELSPAMLRYYFRSKNMPEKTLKKLLKIISEN